MRYSRLSRMESVMSLVLSSALVLFGSAGCAADKEAHDNLTAGFASLQNGSQEDELSDALGHADAQLAKQSTGPAASEALYLRGRAMEKRAKKTPAQATSDFAAARQAYLDALNQSPT